MSASIQPIYLLADSHLLFWSDNGRPFLRSVRERIEADEPKAAYIGAANGDQPEFFSIFEAAMELIGIRDCRMISSAYDEEDRAYLSDADIILLAGGEVDRGWQVMDETGMGEDVVGMYHGNAVVIGVSAGAVLLGLKGWKHQDPEEEDHIFDALELVPCVIDAHDEANQWNRLKKVIVLSGSYHRGVALPAGSGIIYHPDVSMEPVRQPVTEFMVKDEDVVDTLLFPPDASEEPPAQT